MASGGCRINAGRPKGSKSKPIPLNQSDKDKIKEILSIDVDARDKAKRYSDLLSRISKGETLSAEEKQTMESLRSELEQRVKDSKEKGLDNPDAKAFLEALLMAPESEVDRKLKIQIANILLPYQHPRIGEGKGKKEEKEDRAKSAASGKFAPGKAPLKMVK